MINDFMFGDNHHIVSERGRYLLYTKNRKQLREWRNLI